jgi:TetR/AcrR family transcriptional repressor of mexJK operon
MNIEERALRRPGRRKSSEKSRPGQPKSSEKSRRGRPKSPEKSEAILEAAAHLFMTAGMERTSMDAIAAAAGVSKQTVYSHFQSKDDLFRSCVTGKTRSYGLDASRLDETAPLDDSLRYVGRQYLTLLCDKGVICMFRLMIAEANSFPKLVKSFHESGPGATADLVAALVASHLPRHGKGAALTAQVATEFLALVRRDYFLELMLGMRKSIPAAEIRAHVQHCVEQIRKLYPLDGSKDAES